VVKGASTCGGSYVLLSQDSSSTSGRSTPSTSAGAYFLGPGDDATKKAYALLPEAMGRTGRAAIASFVMRTKEYLAAVRADGDVPGDPVLRR
jgi:DNA end-binding protein Ku